ncbi:iron chelate uptake ABC transporter family permease subunit [Rouxiella sp. S1S-2]|uniref:FecCD family ABC transporter permease n=1 Tax=Rouxiella sp. S1S-2 TaxID=2653856 RepID=UPI0012652573|nr:iron ABC transporter permease [Rouxiella sp. S1S-2]KAB7896120.1 iron chelate uptake ABC transporter family permease subunit [Rouxiella sp. S1S-2]
MSSISTPLRQRVANQVWILLGLGVLLIVLAVMAANSGALALSIPTLLHRPFDNELWQIWVTIRLPRVLLAMVVGCGLACSGTVMQGVFRNPLADPGLLGISSGAALFVALMIVFPLPLLPVMALYSQMLAAFCGSLVISFIVFMLSRMGQHGLSRLLLAGIAINAICGAAVGVLTYVSNDSQLRQFSLWSMGTLGQAQWSTLTVAATIIIPASFATQFLARKLNLLQLGDEDAHYLGVNVRQTQRILLLLSALLVGACVAVCGIIGFIGLVIPHLLRMQVGADHRWLLPGSALGGACLLLLADTLARTVVAPAEMPVGLLTALLGGPYFLWLILRAGGQRRD